MNRPNHETDYTPEQRTQALLYYFGWPGDVPEGERAESYYSRGLPVYK